MVFHEIEVPSDFGRIQNRLLTLNPRIRCSDRRLIQECSSILLRVIETKLRNGVAPEDRRQAEVVPGAPGAAGRQNNACGFRVLERVAAAPGLVAATFHTRANQ